MPKNPRSALERDIAALDSQRDAEEARQRNLREMAGLDAMSPEWTFDRKLGEANRGVVLRHAAAMTRQGDLSPTEYRRLTAAMAQEDIGNLSMASYVALRGKRYNDYGALVDVDPNAESVPFDLIRKQMALDSTGDPREDSRLARETAQKAARHLGYLMNRDGVMDDAQYGKWLRTNNLVSDDFKDRDGGIVANDAQLGSEYWLEHAVPSTGYKAGDTFKDVMQQVEAEAAQDDPLAKQKKEMFVSEREAASWRRQDEERRLGETQQGREQLKQAREEAIATAAAMADTTEVEATAAYNTMQQTGSGAARTDEPQAPSQSLGEILSQQNNSN